MAGRKLDPYTLRSVVRSQRARMRRNANQWDHWNWAYMSSFLRRLLDKAKALETKAKKGKRK
jgi:hypothetical protein